MYTQSRSHDANALAFFEKQYTCRNNQRRHGTETCAFLEDQNRYRHTYTCMNRQAIRFLWSPRKTWNQTHIIKPLLCLNSMKPRVPHTHTIQRRHITTDLAFNKNQETYEIDNKKQQESHKHTIKTTWSASARSINILWVLRR